MSKRRKRITRKEQLRRYRIRRALRAYFREKRRIAEERSESLKRYWRRVKRRARKDRKSIKETRKVIARAREAKKARAKKGVSVKAAAKRAEWSGRLFAFNLATVEPSMPERFPRNATITATIEYYQPDDDEPFAVHGVAFESGATNEDFFHAFYKAVREDYKELLKANTVTSEQIIVYLTQLDSHGGILQPDDADKNE